MIYVLSDIHGNAKNFDAILQQICLQPEDTLYILGDVIDRHPDGIRILRKIMSMTNAKMLLGNHEYMMLEALKAPKNEIEDSPWERNWPSKKIRLWYRNGGKVTHDTSNIYEKVSAQKLSRIWRHFPSTSTLR